jgi:hypothetical protein
MLLKLLKGERLKLKWQHGIPVENKREMGRNGERDKEENETDYTRKERKE